MPPSCWKTPILPSTAEELDLFKQIGKINGSNLGKKNCQPNRARPKGASRGEIDRWDTELKQPASGSRKGRITGGGRKMSISLLSCFDLAAVSLPSSW